MKTRHILTIFICCGFAWLYTQKQGFRKRVDKFVCTFPERLEVYIQKIEKHLAEKKYFDNQEEKVYSETDALPDIIWIDSTKQQSDYNVSYNQNSINSKFNVRKQYDAVDSLAIFLNEDKQQSINQLADVLCGLSDNEYTRARLLFAWLATHIQYDDEAYNTNNYQNNDAQSVFDRKLGVCAGYATLAVEIGKLMGLNIVEVRGIAKGYEYSNDNKSNHAWNIVSIDNRKILFDATWGSGYGENVNGKLVSTQEYKPYWFNVPSHEFILSHYPENEADQCLDKPISRQQFRDLPQICNLIFSLNLDSKTYFENLINKQFNSVLNCFNYDIKINKSIIPLDGTLLVSKPYYFEIQTDMENEIYLIDGDEFIPLNVLDNKFSIQYTPKTIFLKLAYKNNNTGNSYRIILSYNVVNSLNS